MDDDARYIALAARDRRFDGVFFVAVTTTGVYCRPVCPARTPSRRHCSFFTTAARAEHAGFRACYRCRPELAPGSGCADVDAVGHLTQRAVAAIAEGALNGSSVADLADRFEVSERHLRRAMEAHVGVSPVQLAQSHRLALAKQLLHDTSLSVTEIGFAAGFSSLRRFNAAFLSVFGIPPREFRRQAQPMRSPGLTLRLDFRPPLDWSAMCAFLAARAIPGVESVEANVYRRSVSLDGVTGELSVCLDNPRSLAMTITPSLLPHIPTLIVRVRRLFDLDAQPEAIARTLSRDALLAPRVRARPGLRLPGAFDKFEAVVRAVLGQQVSVAAAATLAGRLAAWNKPARIPSAADLASCGPRRLASIGLPRARAQAVCNVATAVDNGTLSLDDADLERFVAAATRIPGIGPWTANYIAMRSLHLPDAFVAGDLGVRKALGGSRLAISCRAQAWRPYRAYAVMHLWSSAP